MLRVTHFKGAGRFTYVKFVTVFTSELVHKKFVVTPSFPFDIADEFWLKREKRSPNNDSTKDLGKFTNDSNLTLPNYVEKILKKGPKFRTPHVLNKKFNEMLNLQLETLTYKLRWNDKLKTDPIDENHTIPFKRNIVSLPPNMKKDLEQQLTALKRLTALSTANPSTEHFPLSLQSH